MRETRIVLDFSVNVVGSVAKIECTATAYSNGIEVTDEFQAGMFNGEKILDTIGNLHNVLDCGIKNE